MINKFAIYRFIAPFRSRLQNCLRQQRMSVDVRSFTSRVGSGDRHSEIGVALWDLLRERAFVADFRPDADDDLYKIFGMDSEIIRDEVIDKMLTKLGLSVSGIDFTGFDFASVATPKDVAAFVFKIAEIQNSESKRRFIDVA